MREKNISSFTGQKSRCWADNPHALHLNVPVVFRFGLSSSG